MVIIKSIDTKFRFIIDLNFTAEYYFKSKAIKYPNAANTMK